MKTYSLKSAEYIKSLFIDYTLSKNPNVIIGNEIMYGTGRRLVDLILLKDNRITAVEVKSDSDNLKRIKEQITEYKKIFNFVVLIITRKHLENILEITSNDIGIYLITEDLLIQLIRLPRLQKMTDKREILYSINSRYLKKLSDPLTKKLHSDEIRKYFEKKRLSDLNSLLFCYLQNKISSNFRLFILERGEKTHIEDLSILSTSQNLIE